MEADTRCRLKQLCAEDGQRWTIDARWSTKEATLCSDQLPQQLPKFWTLPGGSSMHFPPPWVQQNALRAHCQLYI